MSVNDPVFTVGDTVSEKTVTTATSSGASTLLIDNPSSIVEGASITGTGITNNTTISNVRFRSFRKLWFSLLLVQLCTSMMVLLS